MTATTTASTAVDTPPIPEEDHPMDSISMHSRFIVVFAMLLTVMLSSSAWAQTSSPESAGEEGQPANTSCPVTTDEEIDPNFSVVYEGREVFFC